MGRVNVVQKSYINALVIQVSDFLLNDLYDWFRDKGLLDEMMRFQQILTREVFNEFESVNINKLILIVERIEQGRTF